MTVDNPKKYRIVLAEDNEDDFVLIRDAIEENGLSVSLEWVKDGQELIDHLHKTPAMPGLVLLDLKMPKKGGIEVLHEIKSDPRLKFVPVVVLSTSSAEKDIRASYEAGANAYVRKPVGFVLFAEAMLAIHDFWFGFAKRPAEGA